MTVQSFKSKNLSQAVNLRLARNLYAASARCLKPSRRLDRRVYGWNCPGKILALILTTQIFAPAAAGQPARDAPSPWTQNHKILVRLVSATSAIGTSGTVKLGLQFKMEPGWRVYWRNPVGASYPPSIKTDGSTNLVSAIIQWPVPQRIPVFGHTTLGYQNKIILPITATIKNPSVPLQFRADLNYLACSEICVPTDTKINIYLPPGADAPTAYTALINRYVARVPDTGTTPDWDMSGEATAQKIQTTLFVVVRAKEPFREPDLMVGGPDSFEFLKPNVRLSDDRRTATFKVPTKIFDDVDPETLPGKKLFLIVSDQGRSAAREIIVAEGTQKIGVTERVLNYLRGLLPRGN